MPVRDWTRVNTGIFHDFHGAWITHLKEALNGGMLPEGYYAMAEQHAGRMIPDVLTLQFGETRPIAPRDLGPVGVAEAPPRVSRKMVASPNAAYRTARRTLAVRHVSEHRLVALVEILSPANKDRRTSVNDFVAKARSALQLGCHLLLIDLSPPGSSDPHGIHGAIWEFFDPRDYAPPADKPLSLVSYVALPIPEAYIEHVGVGDVLPDMALFLEPDWYVNVPLEATYQAAWRGFPAYWRGVLEGRASAAGG
jgi:hypothetical protein